MLIQMLSVPCFVCGKDPTISLDGITIIGTVIYHPTRLWSTVHRTVWIQLTLNTASGYFFDESGYLHIENCRDPSLKLYLEEKMKDWYSWAKSEYREMQGYPPMNVLEIIEKYTKVLKPGFYQTRFNDKVFNFDEETRFWIDELYLPFNHHLPGYVANTGYPRLDAILIDIINSGDSCFSALSDLFWAYR